jgi:hypothetical protein
MVRDRATVSKAIVCMPSFVQDESTTAQALATAASRIEIEAVGESMVFGETMHRPVAF